MLSSENFQSGFQRTGIFLLSLDASPSEYLLLARVYDAIEETPDSHATLEGGVGVSAHEVVQNDDDVFKVLTDRELNLRWSKNEKSNSQRRTMSKLVSGKEIDNTVTERMKEHEKTQKASKCTPKTTPSMRK